MKFSILSLSLSLHFCVVSRGKKEEKSPNEILTLCEKSLPEKSFTFGIFIFHKQFVSPDLSYSKLLF